MDKSYTINYPPPHLWVKISPQGEDKGEGIPFFPLILTFSQGEKEYGCVTSIVMLEESIIEGESA